MEKSEKKFQKRVEKRKKGCKIGKTKIDGQGVGPPRKKKMEEEVVERRKPTKGENLNVP